MSIPAKKAATCRDVLDLPAHVKGELIAGDLYTSARPAPRHAKAETAVGADLDGTRGYDRVTKFHSYAGHGVAWAWIIDPDDRTLEVFRLEDGAWVREAAHQGDVHVRARPLDAVELALAWWWGERPAG